MTWIRESLPAVPLDSKRVSHHREYVLSSIEERGRKAFEPAPA